MREQDIVAEIRGSRRAPIQSHPTLRARICGTALLAAGTTLVVLAGAFWLPFYAFVSAGLVPASEGYQTAIYSAILGIPGLAAGIAGWRLRMPRPKAQSDASHVFD